MNKVEFNALTAGSCIKGEIFAEGDYHLDGKLIGNIECKGKLVMGPNGLLQGDCRCLDGEIGGEIHGDLAIKNKLTLTSTANIKGNVVTTTLCVQPGARFNGNCKMNEDNGVAAAPGVETPYAPATGDAEDIIEID